MPILTHSGRTALAQAVKHQAIYVAWGRGLPAWDSQMPREDRDATALHDEIGRRIAQIVQFCEAADDGAIVVLGGRYRPTLNPSPHLHIQVQFDMEEGLGETIRELALFIGTRTKTELPAGQRYFLPQDLTDTGTLLAIDHMTALQRGVGARVAFDFVMTF